MIIIDRFEGQTAILETDCGMEEISISLLPSNAEESDVLKKNDDGTYFVDAEATKIRRAAIREKLSRLRRKNND